MCWLCAECKIADGVRRHKVSIFYPLVWSDNWTRDSTICPVEKRPTQNIKGLEEKIEDEDAMTPSGCWMDWEQWKIKDGLEIVEWTGRVDGRKDGMEGTGMNIRPISDPAWRYRNTAIPAGHRRYFVHASRKFIDLVIVSGTNGLSSNILKRCRRQPRYATDRVVYQSRLLFIDWWSAGTDHWR